jgi:hypothetical protein
VPTHGLYQVDNEDPLFNSEFETGGGETLQTSAPSGPQTASTAMAVGVVGIPLQHMYCNRAFCVQLMSQICVPMYGVIVYIFICLLNIVYSSLQLGINNFEKSNKRGIIYYNF